MKELKVLKAGYYVKYLMLASIFTFKGWLIMAQPNLYIGTYTGSGSYGIYTAFFNAQNGSITLLDSAKAHNPSYLAVDARRQMLYAVAEDAGTNPGAVGAFKIVGNSLQFINQQPSGGDHPCYVAVHPNGKLIAVANYSGGNFSILPVQGPKGVGSKGQTITHQGNGPNAQRQEKPHVHSTIFSPDGKYLLVADLGTDMVTAYPIPKTSKAKLVEAGAFSVQVAPGAGPRHLAFHPKLPIVYLMEELSGKVSVMSWQPSRMQILQSVQADAQSATPGSADIHVSPDGRFVYASNRADANSISIFEVNTTNGYLKLVGTQSVLGLTPRNFVIHPGGKWLLVANQNSNNIVVFARNEQTGLLTPAGHTLKLPQPVCLVFN